MKVNWMSIQSASELETLGTLKEVKEILSKSIGDKEIVIGKSYEELFQNLCRLQRLVQNTTLSTQEVSSNDSYFQSDAHEYLFYLLELDGELRMKKLGITRQHFSNTKLAKQWYRAIAKCIHPDVCHHPKATLAMSELTQLFQEMSDF